MKTVKVSVGELSGIALDWAVAKCEGDHEADDPDKHDDWDLLPYSDTWVLGGPIIEREGMDLRHHGVDSRNGRTHWRASIQWLDEADFEGIGPAPLIAAMRCYVASKLGNDVEIPKELL